MGQHSLSHVQHAAKEGFCMMGCPCRHPDTVSISPQTTDQRVDSRAGLRPPHIHLLQLLSVQGPGCLQDALLPFFLDAGRGQGCSIQRGWGAALPRGPLGGHHQSGALPEQECGKAVALSAGEAKVDEIQGQ